MIDLLTKQEMLIDRYDSKTIKQMSIAYDSALSKINDRLLKTEDIAYKKRLSSLKALIEKEVSNIYEDMPTTLQDEMSPVAQLAYGSMATAIGTEFVAIPKETMKAIIDLEQVILLNDKGYSISELIGKLEQAHIDKYKQIINAGLASNSGYKSIYDDLKQMNLDMMQRDLEAVTRTVLKQAITNSNAVAFDDFADLIIGWKSVAVLDSRTTPICAGLSNKKYYKSQGYTYEKIPNKPPRHFRCRSILQPLTKISDNLESEQMQSSSNNQISATDSFKDFFERQSPSFQKEWLGDSRYKLFQQGKLKFDEFIDIKNGKLFTLDEIQTILNTK